LPGHKIPTVCIIVEDQAKKAEANLKALREYGIIGRIESDVVVIDLKSVDEDELQIIADGLNKIFGTRQ
jgi:seryl-tRNA(Sec) selenium transferase